MNSRDHEHNIEQIRKGDIKAFEVLYRQYCEPLIQFANRFLYNLEEAQNITQDVFLNVWDKHAALPEKVNIKTYLFTAVKNRSINHIKKRKIENKYRECIVLNEKDQTTPEAVLIHKELQKTVNDMVKELPPKCRLIFLMSRQDQLTYAEIAAILGISIKTVEAQMGRAIKILRKHLSHILPSLRT